jgi:hypothetical protein
MFIQPSLSYFFQGKAGYCFIPYAYVANSKLCTGAYAVKQVSVTDLGKDQWDEDDSDDLYDDDVSDDDDDFEIVDEEDEEEYSTDEEDDADGNDANNSDAGDKYTDESDSDQ